MMMSDGCYGTVLSSLVIKLLPANLHDRSTGDNTESVVFHLMMLYAPYFTSAAHSYESPQT